MSPFARLRAFAAGCRALVRGRQEDDEIDAELRAYLEEAAHAGGERDAASAARHARLALGNPLVIREDTRAAGWEHHVEALWQDVHYGMRLVRRSPGFSAIVILTLTLGAAGTAAIAGLASTLYFGRLPVPDADRVLRLNDSSPSPSGERRLVGMHSQNVAEVQARSDLFEATAAMFGEDMAVTGTDAPERVTVVSRTAGWTRTLGVVPAAGRDFTTDEERTASPSVAIVSDALWRRRFAAATVGSAVVTIDGRPRTIVGVMPPGFRFPYEADVWVPAAVNPADHARDYAVFARMRPGVTLDSARAALDVTSAALRAKYPDELPGYAIAARTLRENLISNESGTALALLCLVVLLHLLAITNVATLLLARSTARRTELALRAALGASRLRRFRQLFTEALIVTTSGSMFGMLLAWWCSPIVVRLLPDNFGTQLGIVPPPADWRVMALSILLALAAALLASAVPALSAHDGADVLREGGRGATRGRRRVLDAFVAAQVALAVVLLAGAGAMLQNVATLQHRAVGFDASKVLTLIVTPSRVTHASGADRAALARRLVDEIRNVPGVTAAGATTVNPFNGTSWSAAIFVEGRGTGRDEDAIGLNHRLVTPGLLQAMGIPLVRGRDFTWDDDAARPPIAIVSATMAARLWPGGDAVGQRVRMARPGSPWITVVGVAGDVADARDAGDPDMTWYLPYAQYAESRAADDIHLMIRGAVDVASLRAAVARVDPMLPIYGVERMDAAYAGTYARDRLGATVMTAFGLFGLLLAGLGIYGVMAFAVNQRTAEIGIRMALGAAGGDITRMVLHGGAIVGAVGLAAGGIGAAAMTRVLASFLPLVRAADPLPSCAAVVVLALVLAAACYVPARRAARVDPLGAIRA